MDASAHLPCQLLWLRRWPDTEVHAGVFVQSCPDGISRLVQGLVHEDMREPCTAALISLVSAPPALHDTFAQTLCALISQLARVVHEQRHRQHDADGQALRVCGEVAAAAIHAHASLLQSSELVALTSELRDALQLPDVRFKAAPGLIELLDSINAWPLANRRQELGAPLFELTLRQLVPLAMYPAEPADISGAAELAAYRQNASESGDWQELLAFRQQEFAALATSTFDLYGFECAPTSAC